MGQIRVLETAVANRIAAGEVIERPASVVKELVENAVDAGATRIVVQAQNGGKTLIQVSDNGCGMDPDDALLCLEPHSTSKIRTTEDIEAIRTMGFRGEAVPSIASVSRFHLQTRLAEAPIGTEVLVEHGLVKEVRECGCAPGTHIRIQHLFGSMPGRRKFLKSHDTEDGHIQECVLMQALAHPQTGFELILNDRQVFFVPPNVDLRTRLGLLLGKEILPNLLPVRHEGFGIRIEGYAALPGETRPNRRDQRIFINGRPAAADTIFYAIREAYGSTVAKGRYPVVVLYLEMDPKSVDVNVHPAKREVRFRNAKEIGDAVLAALQNALRTVAVSGRPALAMPLPGQPDIIPALMPPPRLPSSSPSVSGAPSSVRPSSVSASLPPPAPVNRPPPPAPARSTAAPLAAGKPAANLQKNQEPSRPQEPATPPPPAPRPAGNPEIAQLRILGMSQRRYVVAEGPSGLVLIDPRAAHQRILFERLLQAARSEGSRPQQALLIPVTIDFAPEESVLLQQNLERFQKLGFAIGPFGGRTFIVSAIPASLPDTDLVPLLHEILDDLRHSQEGRNRFDDIRIAKAAARHAISVRQTALSEAEARSLVQSLALCEMPYACPEGRPTMINLPYSDLDRKFGRNRNAGQQDEEL